LELLVDTKHTAQSFLILITYLFTLIRCLDYQHRRHLV